MKDIPTKNLCAECRDKRAGFKTKGKWKRDKLHTLCSRCYKKLLDKVRQANIQQMCR